MEKDDLIEKLNEMNKPDFISEEHQHQLKLALLNAHKSGRIGVVLVILPLIFLAGVFCKYLLNIHLEIFNSLEEWMVRTEKSYLKILVPFILIGAPFIGLAINLLAILHIRWNRKLKELIITVKLKWFNIIVSLICVFILMTFLLYAIAEN